MYRPPPYIPLDRETIPATMSNPDLSLNQNSDAEPGPSLDCRISNYISITIPAAEIEISDSVPGQYVSYENTMAKRYTWMWVFGLIDTISPLFFMFWPILMVFLGLQEEYPTKFLEEIPVAYLVLHASYVIQLIIGCLLAYDHFKRVDKYLPIIILAHMAGTEILLVCNYYFVYCVGATLAPLIQANISAFEMLQFMYAICSLFRAMFIIIWYCFTAGNPNF